MKLRPTLAVLVAASLLFGCSSGTQEETSTASSSVQSTNTKDDGPIKGQAYITDENSVKNILQIAMASPDHTTLAAGVAAAGLENVLANNGPLTVFAPTNAAFDKLPPGTLEELLKPENKEKLAHIITFHAAPGSYDADHIKGVMGIGQATGDKVEVTIKDGTTFVNGAKVVGSVKAANGYVHVIDQVLLPPE